MCGCVFTLLIAINPTVSINHISNAKTWYRWNFPVHLSPPVSSRRTHHLGPTASKPPHWFPPPLRPATGDETDSSHISAQLDGVFIITTQQGSDRGRKQQRERWWSGGSNGGGEELGWQEGMKEGGGQEGGRMNRKKRGELGAVRCRGRGLCRGCQGVCLCFFLHACMHVFISVCVTWHYRHKVKGQTTRS